MKVMAEGDWAGFRDDDRHMIITMGWRKAGAVLSFLMRNRDLAKNMEMQVRSAMKASDYDFEGLTDRQIAGQKAGGFRYTYKAGEVQMAAESCVFKLDKDIYYIHLYARQELRDESFRVWEEFLKGIKQ